jgi:hypothetical protein
MESTSQSGQDIFVRTMLHGKQQGYFLEIGSNHPKEINNTYLLEKQLSWRGIMVEYDAAFLPLYALHRPLSIHCINDATKVDYLSLFESHSFPSHLDYLQIDLEVSNGSTIGTLQLLDHTIMDNYTFATITFEHDSYRGNHFDTRQTSRDLFNRRGYQLLFPDVKNNGNVFEDWYVHPQLVDNHLIQRFQTTDSLEYTEIIRRLQNA